MDTTKTKCKTIDEYIKTFPKEVQEILQRLRQTIKDVIPEAKEKISYNMPTFTVNGDYIIYFAAWKKHISLYPYTSAMEASFPEASIYNISGKGTIQFPLDTPLPLPLIREIVTFRVKEILQESHVRE